MNIIEPLPGSLVISFKGKTMKVPLIYEGLHEVCALFGSESHQIDSCPKLPAQSKVEIVVEKFGGTKVTTPITTSSSSHVNAPVTIAD